MSLPPRKPPVPAPPKAQAARPSTPPRQPAAHVAAAVQAVQMKAAAPGRQPAAHVQATLAAVQRKAAPALIQPSSDKGGRTRGNVGTYSSITGKGGYSKEEVDKAVEELGFEIHGHRSGGSGSGVSNQTKTEMGQLVGVLRKNRDKAKKEKKKTTPKETAPLSDVAKARNKAEEIFKAKGKDGMEEFSQYMDNRGYTDSMDSEQQDELYAIFL
jgi:hypothetical protein